MSHRNATNLLAGILGCSILAAGTAVSFAADSLNDPSPSDSQITQQVMQKLTREGPQKFAGLKVETQDGVVTLSGRANTELYKLKALQDARQVRGVTDVKDQLSVSE
jgi:osmotically-inducible protein OsmY